MVYQIPPFLMGQAANVDFSPVQNALAQWRQDQRFNAQNALARDKLAEDSRQFNASNALSREHLGIAQRSAARADELAPYNLQQLKVQIDNARASGAREAELFPLMKQARELEIRLNQAKAEGKDTETQMMRSLGLAGEPAPNALAPRPQGPTPQPQPQLQPQSYAPAQADPNFIRTADGVPGQPAPSAEPSAADVIKGMNPAQRAQFGLSFIGKGDAAKVLGDVAEKDKLDKTARGEVEKDLVGLTGTIGRLESIEKRFDPKFLEIPNRAGLAWSALADKFGALPEDQKADLSRYTKFRQTSVQNAALYVKYLSGVAVSEQEFARIMKTLPNAGTGIADGDSPTEFQAKMKESVTQAKMAYARAVYLRNQGFKGKPWEAGVALDDVRGIVDQRGAQLEQELQGKVPPERMGPIIRQRLKQEFGI